MRRVALVVLLGVIGLALQTSVLSAVSLVGTKPELLLLIVVALAMTDGAGLGALAGFICGVMTDALGEMPQGLGALTFTLAGYSVGTFRTHVATPSAWLPMGTVAATTFLATAFYGLLAMILGQETLTVLRILRHAVFASMYGALLTPFAFPPVRALASRLRKTQTVEAL